MLPNNFTFKVKENIDNTLYTARRISKDKFSISWESPSEKHSITYKDYNLQRPFDSKVWFIVDIILNTKKFYKKVI